LNALGAGKQGRICQHGQQIVTLKVLVISEQFIVRHAGAKQLKQHFDWVSETANTRLTVANGRVNRDAGKQGIHAIIIPTESGLKPEMNIQIIRPSCSGAI
jgi:hypothetical protein